MNEGKILGVIFVKYLYGFISYIDYELCYDLIKESCVVIVLYARLDLLTTVSD